uniref:Proliferating cell nuclear antigen PCNA N-terminal domain-containing protein n=1 Tax=viral metagenome TaxID=1070528 RepID=A0A6C0IAN2_9ZZZZ
MNVDNVLYIKTVQSQSIKILVESLKEVLTDVNLYFDVNGLKIMTMDNARVALVYVRLLRENFEEYLCKNKLVIGINMIYLFKLLKTVGNNDVLTLFIKNEAINELGIRIENKEKNTITESYLKMLDIAEEKLEIPDIQYDSVISMPSVDLQKYCRDLSVISGQLCITSTDSKFILEAAGDFASQRIIIGEAQNGLIFSKKNQTVCEIFDLKYLNSFTKSTNLCSTVEIFLKKEYPLVIEYNVANLGKLQFCLAPKIKEE